MLKHKDTFPPRQIAPGNTPVQGRLKPSNHVDARTKIESRPHPQVTPIGGAVKSFAPLNLLAGNTIISDTAAALGNDVDAIYNFVRNKIQFTPTYGSQRGAISCLLNGQGNAFDISDLFLQLLVAAGHQAKFLFGELKLTGQQAGDWLGSDVNNVWAARNMLLNGGIPADAFWDGITFTYYLEMSHVWVEVLIGSTWYVFDPSYKAHTTVAGVNLTSATGYNGTTFEAAALTGATVDAHSIQNINAANIASQMNGYEANLVSWIETNKPDATVDDLLGYRPIIEDTAQVRQTSLSYQKPATTPTEWLTIPNAYKTTLRVQYDTIDATFYSSDLATKRLTLFFNASLQAELKLDGTLIGTSAAQGVGTWNSVLLTVTHPYADTWANQSFYQRIWAGQYYLIANAWGAATPEMAYAHQEDLIDFRDQGLSDTSEPVLGEALSVLWHTWNAQKSIMASMIGRLNNCSTVLHHQVGIVGHGESPFMDLGGIVWSTSANDNDYSKVAKNDTVLAMRGIGFESNSISQIPNINGVSTNTVLERANAAGQKIYYADSSNWAANVRPFLINYSTQVLDDIENWYINAGWAVMIHENGETSQNSYQGYGIYAISPYGGCVGLINGYLLGGAGDTVQTAAENSQQASANQLRPGSIERVEVGEHTEWEIDFVNDLYSGSVDYRHTDFACGNGRFPWNLPFTRFHSGRNAGEITHMGKGWRHNYMISVKESTQAFASLGDQGGKAAAGNLSQLTIANLQVDSYAMGKYFFAFHFLTNTDASKKLTGNVAIVKDADRTYTFSKLSDNTYISPKGVRLGIASISQNFVTHFQMQSFEGVIYEFRPDGQIEKITYPSGVVVTFTYAGMPDNRLLTVKSEYQYYQGGQGTPSGETLTFAYRNSLGLLYYIETVTSSRAGLIGTYDINLGTAELLKFTDRASFSTGYTYDAEGRLKGYSRPGIGGELFPTYSVTYDSSGRVTTLSGPGTTTTFQYLDFSKNVDLSGITNNTAMSAVIANGPKGMVTTFFNLDGQPTKIDENGVATSYRRDGLGRIVETDLPHGEIVLVTYDAWDRVLTKIRQGQGVASTFESWTYVTPYQPPFLTPAWDKWETYTNARGKVFNRTYDATGSIATETGPVVNGQTPTKTWVNELNGWPIEFTDETGIKTVYAYNNYGDVTSVTADSGVGRLNLVTQFGYDVVGNKNSVTDQKSNVTTFTFDQMRRLTGSTAPAPFLYQTVFELDQFGNKIATKHQTGGTPAWQTTTVAYTARHLPTLVTDPLGYATETLYSTRDLPNSVKDALNHTRQYLWTTQGQLWQIIDANNVVEEERTYTGGGLIATIKDARNNISTYEHDAFARQTKLTYPDATYEQWVYDANNNVTSFRNRQGQTITQTFDNLDRLATKSPQGQAVVTYSYDLAGRLLSASTPVVSGNPSTGVFSKGYDTAGRLISETNPQNQVISYQLDANGNTTRVTYPSGYYVEYGFDQLNRMTGIKLNGATVDAATFGYDQLSRRTSKGYNNTNTVGYTYDLNNRLTARSMTVSGGTVNWAYGYNNIGQITSQGVSDPTYEWTPSAASSVPYGAANNRNQYPTVGGVTQTHNNNGSLTGDTVWTFGYNAENMLTSAVKTGTNASFVYDPFLRQTQKTVGSAKTKYVYSGSHLMEEYNGATNALLRRYVYAGAEEPIFQIASNGTVTYLHHDHLGSVIAQANASGVVGNKYKYSPWGESPSLTGTTIGYTAQRWDSELSQYNYRARYYRPSTGRFLQTDPIGYKEDLNLYTYVKNDPLNHTDPAGLASFEDFAAPYQDGSAFQTGAAALILGLEIQAALPSGFESLALIPGTLAAGLSSPVISNAATKYTSKLGAGSTFTLKVNPPVAFIGTSKGTIFPVPKGAVGPVPNISPSDKITGTNFAGGKMGANGKVANIHLMFPTTPKGKSPGYPNGYIKYTNTQKQNVDPHSGQTGNKAGLGSGGISDNMGPHFGLTDY